MKTRMQIGLYNMFEKSILQSACYKINGLSIFTYLFYIQMFKSTIHCSGMPNFSRPTPQFSAMAAQSTSLETDIVGY